MEGKNDLKVGRAVPVTFFICQSCGRFFRTEDTREKCCRGMPKDPKYNNTVILYKCSKCGQVHNQQLSAEACTHWTDDEELMEEEGEDGTTGNTVQ